ncbi:MAG: class I SAM-dependent methyltransferase [bacterium]|nr:class I SAM-dependent methyltransferase [bacterium]
MHALSYPHAVPFNKLCGTAEVKNPAWWRALRDLDLVRPNAPFHRKGWEFAQAIYGLRKLKSLPPNALALGVGSGHERILYFLANRIARVVATDLYEGDFAEKEACPIMLHTPEMFAPFHYRKEHLDVLTMDAMKLDFPSNTFDIVFSFSSIEHFGGHREAVLALREMFRVLKPGGAAVVTTELILNRLGRTRGFFRRREIEPLFLQATGFELVGDGVDYRVERRFLRQPMEFPYEPTGKPCVVLRRGLTLFTSIALFLRKPAAAGSAQPLAATGDEIVSPLRRFIHRADIAPSTSRLFVKRGGLLCLPLTLRNLGDVVWYNYSSQTHIVRLGVHLLSRTGDCLARDFARQDLPVSVNPGEDVRLDLLATAPNARGDFLLELDVVKEGVLWFAEESSSASRVSLTVE